MYPVQAYWTSLLVGLFLNDYFHRLMAGFLPNQQCLKTYSDHLWPFDHDSIVWNLSRSFWSSHAQSSWLLIPMFTEKATRGLFGSCPLLVVYHSDVLCFSGTDRRDYARACTRGWAHVLYTYIARAECRTLWPHLSPRCPWPSARAPD